MPHAVADYLPLWCAAEILDNAKCAVGVCVTAGMFGCTCCCLAASCVNAQHCALVVSLIVSCVSACYCAVVHQ
ncbi:hypothetical protein COO60DRAFT_1484959 [Scenedesmus sp. NREL 46B-D3]|nr:hypothetical protein COO60DRAFT_1484959 [Scenedesmus sp. NREL 46B-D3]